MKQRLVGALVLLCAGVLLWNALFSRPAEYAVDKNTQVPPAMVVEKPTPIEPRRPSGVPTADQPRVSQSSAQYSESGNEPETRKSTIPPDDGSDLEVVKLSPKPEPKPSPSSAEAKVGTTAGTTEVRLDPQTKLPIAWVVQVGSYGNRDNANALMNKLRDAGFKAYIRRRETSKGEFYRVMVGPKLDKAAMMAEQRQIDQQFNTNSLLTRFER